MNKVLMSSILFWLLCSSNVYGIDTDLKKLLGKWEVTQINDEGFVYDNTGSMVHKELNNSYNKTWKVDIKLKKDSILLEGMKEYIDNRLVNSYYSKYPRKKKDIVYSNDYSIITDGDTTSKFKKLSVKTVSSNEYEITLETHEFPNHIDNNWEKLMYFQQKFRLTK